MRISRNAATRAIGPGFFFGNPLYITAVRKVSGLALATGNCGSEFDHVRNFMEESHH